jgi:ATP adenylyltransferase
MDYLWTPWRYQFVQDPQPPTGCIFCDKPAEHRDEHNFILHRASHNFVILNLYPYTSGHLMIVPYSHVATLDEAGPLVRAEMIELAARAESLLRAAYHPEGLNLGFNLGKCAGAGIAAHLHLHVLPRWTGDANFMSVIGETRVIPEDIPTTYAKLRQGWD